MRRARRWEGEEGVDGIERHCGRRIEKIKTEWYCEMDILRRLGSTAG